MSKIKRNLDTEENRKFWGCGDIVAEEVDSWPDHQKHSLCKRGDCAFHRGEDCRPDNGLERAIKRVKKIKAR